MLNQLASKLGFVGWEHLYSFNLLSDVGVDQVRLIHHNCHSCGFNKERTLSLLQAKTPFDAFYFSYISILISFILYLFILHSQFFNFFISSIVTILHVLLLLYVFISSLTTPWSLQPELHTHCFRVLIGRWLGSQILSVFKLVLNCDISCEFLIWSVADLLG